MSLAWNGQEIAGLALNGSAVSAAYNGSIVWPTATTNAKTFWVTSDNPNVYVTGTVYNSLGNTITSLVANGNSASAEVSTDAVSARMTASAADYYATLFNGDGGSSFTQDWIRNGRYGSGTVQYSGSSLVLGSHSGQTNKFTAGGRFATAVTASRGWFVPAYVTYVNKAVGTYKNDVSANKTYNRKIRTVAGQESSSPITQNGLWGTFSAVSGVVSQYGSSYRIASNGNFSYPMRQGGPYYWLSANVGSGAYSTGKWVTTNRWENFQHAGPWILGTGIETGDGNTLHIDAWYSGTAIFTVTTGAWDMTGIAK